MAFNPIVNRNSKATAPRWCLCSKLWGRNQYATPSHFYVVKELIQTTQTQYSVIRTIEATIVGGKKDIYGFQR